MCPKCAVNFGNLPNLKSHVETCNSAMLRAVEVVEWQNPIVDVMADTDNIPAVSIDTDNIPVVTVEDMTAPSAYYQYY